MLLILAMIGKFWGLAPLKKGLWNKNSPLLRHIIAKSPFSPLRGKRC